MSIGIWQVLIILLIVLVLFGTKRLRNAGSDLGEAIRGFKRGMREDDPAQINANRPDIEPGPAAEPDPVRAASGNASAERDPPP